MIELFFEIGGDEISLNQIEDESEKAVLQKNKQTDLEKSTQVFVRCPDHHQLPKITV